MTELYIFSQLNDALTEMANNYNTKICPYDDQECEDDEKISLDEGKP